MKTTKFQRNQLVRVLEPDPYYDVAGVLLKIIDILPGGATKGRDVYYCAPVDPTAWPRIYARIPGISGSRDALMYWETELSPVSDEGMRAFIGACVGE